MHTVVIGIGCDYDVLVSEVVCVVLDAEGVDEKVQLLVFGNFSSAFLIAVDRLSSKTEYSLYLCVSCFGDCSARGITLGYEETGLFGKFLLCCRQFVIVMKLAVTELAVIYVCPLVSFLCLLLYAGDFLTLFLG